MNILIWVKALRAPFLTATIVPFLFGGAVTYHLNGMVDVPLFILTGIGLICLHLGTNTANDYYDNKYNADRCNDSPTAFSGGSRAIQEGSLSAEVFLITSVMFFTAGLAIAAYLFFVVRSPGILVIAAVGALSGYYYTAGPLKLAYRGLGELAVGLNFGPLIALGTYLVQTKIFSWQVFLLAMPICLLMIAMIVLNEFPDYEADKRAGKKTLIVRLGKQKGVYVYQAVVLSVFLYVGAGMAWGYYPGWAGLVFLSAPLAVHALVGARAHYRNTDLLLPAMKSNILLHLLFGLLLCAGFLPG